LCSCGPCFPWNDLLPELRKDILARVPLLRLAQLAVQCKEFRDAYRQRQEAQKEVATSLPCPLVQPLGRDFWTCLPVAFWYPGTVDHFWWISPRRHGRSQLGSSRFPLEGVVRATAGLWPGLYSKAAAMSVQGWYIARGPRDSPCSASVELRCVLKFGFRRRSVVCKELVLDCSDAPVEVPPTIRIPISVF
jgi:hypothetical protein